MYKNYAGICAEFTRFQIVKEELHIMKGEEWKYIFKQSKKVKMKQNAIKTK